jgi:DNA polymerase-3 subunit beta
MQFVIDRDQFVHSVQHVSKAISSRTTIPILTGIKIVADQDGVTITGSDSDISIESFIPVEEDGQQFVQILEEGSIILQAKVFVEIIKKLPKSKIEIVVNEQFSTIVRSGPSIFNLNGLDPEEYPRLPEIEEEKIFQIPNDLLKNIIKQTVFAVSTAETRPILTGVNWHLGNKILSCTATDSHRLALRKAVIETNIDDLAFNNVVIPGKSLIELNKILEDNNELLTIFVTENQILFKSKNLLFYSRLLDGTYPATNNMIPDHSKTDILLETKGLLQAIERALLLSQDGKNNVVNLKTIEDGIIEITSITPEVGKVTENINPKQLTGEDLRISFNGKNIIDTLKIIDSNEIKISFTGSMSPFLIRPVGHENTLHLFSPVRTY